MHKPSKQTTILIFAIGILSFTGGVGLTYFALSKNTPASSQTEPEKVSNAVSLEEKIPEGTVSPTTLVQKADEYAGKEVRVRGLIVKQSDQLFLIVGQEKEKPAGIKLENSNNIDLNKYAVSQDSNTASETTGPVTIKGSVVKNEKEFKLVIHSIEQ